MKNDVQEPFRAFGQSLKEENDAIPPLMASPGTKWTLKLRFPGKRPHRQTGVHVAVQQSRLNG